MRARRPLLPRGRLIAAALAVAAMAAAPVADAFAQNRGHGGGGFSRGSQGGGYGMPRGRGGPNWGGVATGIGIGIAAGAILGAAAAHADHPPPPPPPGVYPPSRRSPNPPQRQQPAAAIDVPPAGESRFVPDEVVLEFTGPVSPQAMNALAVRHRLTRLESQSLALTNSTVLRARITDGRPVRSVLRGLGRERALRAGQPNYRYVLQRQLAENTGAVPDLAPGMGFTPPEPATPAPTPVLAPAGALPRAGDPAQYAIAKLRLGKAHGLASGSDVLVAVIDSGIDADHPELRGAVAGQFDALGAKTASKTAPAHPHGTAMAGAIAAQARLLGVAPGARLLAIRAFGAPDMRADGTTFAILRGLDHAAANGARVVNMSFAGPRDPALSRQLRAARTGGIVLVAAAGNAGPRSAPLYPAADPSVIAVTATDAEDRLLGTSNRGRHLALAAPGVDILVPAPGGQYEITSGTSVAAAHVSGIAALVLERRPDLPPQAVRNILTRSARDLGPRGRDDQFGAGLVDAYQAILALTPQAAAR